LLKKLPWWLLAAVLLAVLGAWSITSQANYRQILLTVGSGLGVTLAVTLVSFAFASVLGLGLGLMRVSSVRIVREISTFYVEIVRGIPMLVILYYIAFVGAPGLVELLKWVGFPVSLRDLDFTGRAVLALTLGYAAFLAEIFRAGMESIHQGQMEAALALGHNRLGALVHVILPQAFRNALPPLGNEFVAMVKDSALVSALGVQDLTQLGKVYSAGSFQFFETYNVVAYLYLVLTVSLSLGVRALENRLGKHKAHVDSMR
jgi:polar amino acid transport system permease protein